MLSLWKIEREQVADLWWHTRRGGLRQRGLAKQAAALPSKSNENVLSEAQLLNSEKSAKVDNPKHDDDLLLNVPFYVYEDLLWIEKGTIGDLTVQEWIKERKVKHTDDFWFAKASLTHPMRTLDPNQAQLFVVPTLLNEICDQMVWIRKGLCVNGACDIQLMEQVDQYLANSTWFQRNQGNDHVLVASHYLAHQILQPFHHLAKCHVIGFEDRLWNAPNRLTLPSTYVGKPCPPQPNDKTHDFALVASIKPRPTHRRRANVCTWLQQEQQQHHYRVAACGESEQCPNLSGAKFGFHVEGDTLGSQRLMDTILSETVPIFTHPGQYDILPSWIDWEAVSVHVNAESPQMFSQTLQDVTHDEAGYHSRMKQIRENRKLFDWTTQYPFDAYMYAFARQTIPEQQSKANISPYSILLLDQIEQVKDGGDDDESERYISCGDHEAPSCGLCAPPSRPPLCSGQCMWCDYGAQGNETPLLPADRCVPKSATCRPPDDLLVQPNDVVYDTEGWETSPIVLEKQKLIFFTVAKNACTTWKQLFRRMMGYQDWAVEGTEEMLPWNPRANGLKYLFHYDRATATEMLTSSDWTKAFFVRDPKERLLSAYLDKVKKEPAVVWNTCCIEERDCVSPSSTTFGEFTKLAFECENEHWSPQYSRIEEKYWPYINFVGYMHSIAQDSRRLLQQLGVWEDVGASGWGEDGSQAIFESRAGSVGRKHATSAGERLKQHYTPLIEKEVEKFYKMDYHNPYTNLTLNRIF